jgi:hypothetical protein
MKPEFNLDIEMNGILASESVKTASIKTASILEEKNNSTSLAVAKIAEMAIELNKRGMSKTATALKAAAISLIEASSDEEVKHVGQLYGLVK